MGTKKSASKLQKANSQAASSDTGHDPSRRQACIKLAGSDDPIIFFDGHDDAIIGLAERDGYDVVVYDSKKIIRKLRRRDGMSEESANEFFSHNIAGLWVGDATPVCTLTL